MSKFGPKTTAALAICLPRYNGVLAKKIPTQSLIARRAASFGVAVLAGILLLCLCGAP